MRRLVVGSLVLSCSTLAHAEDPRDVFGLGKKTEPSGTTNDPRDAFGLKPKPKTEPVDCGDGTAFGCVGASDPLDEHASPYTLSTWLPARYLLRLPVASASHDAVAHYALGASRDEAGPFFAGANGLENRWLVEGAPADGLRTGIADTRVPLAFLDGMWITAGGFTARDRASTGGMIDAELRGGTQTHEVDARAWIGWTAPSRQRAIPRNSYYVIRGEQDIGPEAVASVVATGPLASVGDILGGRAWYAAGIAPELNATKLRWTSQTIVDLDDDDVPDGYPGFVVTEQIGAYARTPLTWRVPFMLRGGLDRGVHQVDVTLVGAAATDQSYLANATLQAAGVESVTLAGDAIATWRGKWARTRAKAQLAWHRTMRDESARDPAAANLPQLLSAYVPATLAEDPAIAAACLDPDPADQFTSCPVPYDWFISGGAGRLTDTTGDRPSLTVDLAHRLGNNVMRIGATGEDTRLVHETHFTGGTQIRSLFPGHESQRRFADPDQTCSTDIALPCPTVDTSVLSYRTRYTAAYVEDTWHAAPNLAVDGGVRWELMWVGPVLHFSNQLSPRLGMSWDPLGKGQSRVWTSMGRSYAYLPAGLGPTIIRGEKTVDRIISSFGEGRSVDTGSPYPVTPGIEPITQDELTTGAQLAFAPAVRATMWLQGRWLRRGLDTTAGRFDNPGRTGGTPALRETGLIGAEVATSPTAKTVLRLGYMYGRTIGSWTGAFDPRQGAVLYAGSDFDTTSVNQLGRLPTDIGHRTYIEAERGGRVGYARLAVAARLTAGSGRPRSVIGESFDGDIYLIPRGSAGRGPAVTQANIRVSALWQGFDITLDLFNVFDRRDALTLDERYARGSVQPIDGGTLSDLVFLKTDDGRNAVRRTPPSYALGTSFQSPFSAVLGVHRAF